MLSRWLIGHTDHPVRRLRLARPEVFGVFKLQAEPREKNRNLGHRLMNRCQ